MIWNRAFNCMPAPETFAVMAGSGTVLSRAGCEGRFSTSLLPAQPMTATMSRKLNAYLIKFLLDFG
jgi:hypothetical protein